MGDSTRSLVATKCTRSDDLDRHTEPRFVLEESPRNLVAKLVTAAHAGDTSPYESLGTHMLRLRKAGY
jgi:hypothetical protein